MNQAFVIIQIGNPELDMVYEKVFVPAIRACGLEPKRVDKHTEGGLLKSEIIDFILTSDIIVADLTNERPNCYLEVGYAMGVDKFKNLILCAKENHNPDSPNHHHGGPKVHFDLIGYDVLFWDPDRLEDFRTELEKRIRRRRAVIAPAVVTAKSPWDDEWLQHNKKIALEGLEKSGMTGFMEVTFALSDPKPNKIQRELLEAANDANIDTFGWPIGIVLNTDEYKPRPMVDGIVAEIATGERGSYDYWTLKRNGDFYLLKSLFEDVREPGTIFFNTRIVRVTETLLYCARLYSRLEVPGTAFVNIGVRHGGLSGRTMTSSGGRPIRSGRSTIENEVHEEVCTSLLDIESNLVEIAKKLTNPLFAVFEYFEVSSTIYEEIVNNFVEGKVI